MHYILTALGSSVATLIIHSIFGTTITAKVTAEVTKLKGELIAEVQKLLTKV